jgi:hypothetical protein
MQIDCSAEQPANADSPRIETLQPGANITCRRVLQSQKQHFETTSRDAGREIDRSDVQCENAFSPIVEMAEPASNVTLERPWHELKHSLEMVFIEDGMQIA